MKKNYSYTYIMPILSETINIDEKLLSFFINSYMFTNNSIELGKIFIKCKFNYSSPQFSVWESILTDNELYIDSKSVEDEIIYEFKMPLEYIEDQKLFIQGRYSEISKTTQNLIIRYWLELYGNRKDFVMTIVKKIKGVFNKADWLRLEMENDLNISISKNKELGNLINIENETYIFKEDKSIKFKDMGDIFKK